MSSLKERMQSSAIIIVKNSDKNKNKKNKKEVNDKDK
jgi:hypothetical protein